MVGYHSVLEHVNRGALPLGRRLSEAALPDYNAPLTYPGKKLQMQSRVSTSKKGAEDTTMGQDGICMNMQRRAAICNILWQTTPKPSRGYSCIAPMRRASVPALFRMQCLLGSVSGQVAQLHAAHH